MDSHFFSWHGSRCSQVPLSHLSPLPEVSLLADRNKNAPILLYEQNGEDQMLREHKAVHQKGSPRLDQGVLQNAHIVLSSPGERQVFLDRLCYYPCLLETWVYSCGWGVRWLEVGEGRRVQGEWAVDLSPNSAGSYWSPGGINSCSVWHTMRPQKMLVAIVNVYILWSWSQLWAHRIFYICMERPPPSFFPFYCKYMFICAYT